MGQHVYGTGEYEPATTLVIKALLRPGDTFVDVGANVGYFSLLASQRVGARGKVFAFEPLPATREDLIRNRKLNDATNVIVREEALADSSGEVDFFAGPVDHCGTSSLRHLCNGSGVVRVRKGRLDDLLAPEQRVTLVKIDVEGAEYLALLGMRGCLLRDHPDLIIEITDAFLRGLGHSTSMLIGELFSLGYRMYRMDHDCLVPVPEFTEDLPDQLNALFTARPDLPPSLKALVKVPKLAPCLVV